MFNTYKNGRIPYITTMVANCDPNQRVRLLGPAIGHLFIEEGTGDRRHLKRLPTTKLMRRLSMRMILNVLAGDRRRAVLFEPDTVEPIAQPDPQPPDPDRA